MKGVLASAPVPKGSECARCRFRWAQHPDGLCRWCHRAATNCATDPLVGAITTLRKFIRHAEIKALAKEEPEFRRMDRLNRARDAQSALDLLLERLRDARVVETKAGL